MSKRDDIRTALIGKAVQFKKKKLKLGDTVIEIRQPSLKGRQVIRDKVMEQVGTEEGKSKFDMLEFQMWSVIYMTFVPGTQDRVFDEADIEIIRNQPAGGFVDQAADICGDFLNLSALIGNMAKNLNISAETTESKNDTSSPKS